MTLVQSVNRLTTAAGTPKRFMRAIASAKAALKASWSFAYCAMVLPTVVLLWLRLMSDWKWYTPLDWPCI